MASLASYAKLSYFAKESGLSQFQPEEVMIFRLLHSEDLCGKYATLIIDGYSETVRRTGVRYEGTKVTYTLGEAIGGQWMVDYEIPSGTLGESFPNGDGGDIAFSGKMQARVEIGDEIDGDGYVVNPVITSNVCICNMIILRSATISFDYTPYSPTGSTFKVWLDCDHILNYGVAGAEEVQSYRIYLYDRNYNMIFDSGELYDWDSGIYGNRSYTLYDLQDDTTYYVKGRITLNGGYHFTSGFVAINVDYSSTPSYSDDFTVSPTMGNVKMSVDLGNLTHTKVVFSRTVKDESDYLEIVTVENPDTVVTAMDKFPIPGKEYVYRAVIYNGSNIVGTYYNHILYQDNYIKISDAMGSYIAVAEITKHPINRNDRGSILIAMDSKFPYHIINGDADYDSGTVDGFFTTINDDCSAEMDNAALSKILRAWLNNGRAKLLTYYTGEAWLVGVQNVSTTDPNNDDAYNTSFAWTAIGDASIMSEYIRLGLILDE